MLKFTDFLITGHSSVFKNYLTYFGEEIERGSKSSFRGKLNEFAFVHAFSRYHELLKQHKGNHDKAIQQLAAEGHKSPNHPFNDKIKEINDKIGDEETEKTLQDSHHGALATINHIHESTGGITGTPVWSGVDQTGKTVEKITGYNTPADMVVPTKSGWHHLSLKYSGEEKNSPTKLAQPTAEKMVEHIQNTHVKNFGKRDETLDDELQKLKSSFGTSSLNDKETSKKLKSAGFSQNENGEFAKGKLNKLARYASELSKTSKKNTEERTTKLRSALENHFYSQNIPQEQHDEHIKNLAGIYDNVLKSNKRKASVSFMDALHNSIKRIHTQGNSGQHSMIKNMLNINPPGDGKFMVVKTKRSDGNLPDVQIADHSKSLDEYLGNQKENELYDSLKTEKTASATISRKNGDNIASLALETSKSIPTIVASAGKDIDKFESISDKIPGQVSSNPKKQPSVSVAVKPPKTSTLASAPVKPAPTTHEGTFGGKDFYSDDEKLHMQGLA